MVRSGVVLAVALLALLAAPAQAQDRYALANGCYALRAAGGHVAETADGGYRIAAAGESFRMQATALGRYLLYGRDGDFLAYGKGALPISPSGCRANPARAGRPTGASTAATARSC